MFYCRWNIQQLLRTSSEDTDRYTVSAIYSLKYSVVIGDWGFETTYFSHLQVSKYSRFSRNLRHKLVSEAAPHVIRTEMLPKPLCIIN
jgi:hypothetical protein